VVEIFTTLAAELAISDAVDELAEVFL